MNIIPQNLRISKLVRCLSSIDLYILLYVSPIIYLTYQVVPGSRLKSFCWIIAVFLLFALLLRRFLRNSYSYAYSSDLKKGVVLIVFLLFYAFSFILRSGVGLKQYLLDILPQYVLASCFLIGYLKSYNSAFDQDSNPNILKSRIFLFVAYFLVLYLFYGYISSAFLHDTCIINEVLDNRVYHCSNLINSDISIFVGARNSLIALPLCLLTMLSIEYSRYRLFSRPQGFFVVLQVVISLAICSIIFILITSGSKVASVLSILLIILSVTLTLKGTFHHLFTQANNHTTQFVFDNSIYFVPLVKYLYLCYSRFEVNCLKCSLF